MTWIDHQGCSSRTKVLNSRVGFFERFEVLRDSFGTIVADVLIASPQSNCTSSADVGCLDGKS